MCVGECNHNLLKYIHKVRVSWARHVASFLRVSLSNQFALPGVQFPLSCTRVHVEPGLVLIVFVCCVHDIHSFSVEEYINTAYTTDPWYLVCYI